MSAQPAGRLTVKGPDKGSFPLDHFHECDQDAKKYSACLQKHQLMPKRCRQFQVDYLKCRMQNGLMENQDVEKLGFTQNLSWESEEQEKQFLFNKIQNLKKQAEQKYNMQQEFMQKQAQQQQAQQQQQQPQQ